MSNKAKITIIVPVYKVEPYLYKCLDSIVGQTYQNLQIILVDDGSPDNCGNICDEYAVRDSRIKVIHKENGGVSSARNAGLNAATGDWIGWVDSDDWIESDMYEYLLKCAVEHNADIAVCSRYEEYSDYNLFRGCNEKKVMGTEEALALLLEDDMMQNFLWDKLWRRNLFTGVTFPEGKTYEDVEVMHKLFEQAKKIIYLPDGKYHYLQRSGSIVNEASLANRINYYNAALKRYEDMREQWPQFSQQLEGQCVSTVIGIWCCYLKSNYEERKKYKVEIQNISRFSKLHYKSALKYLGLGTAGKTVVLLTRHTAWWAFALARLCGFGYKIRHRREL